MILLILFANYFNLLYNLTIRRLKSFNLNLRREQMKKFITTISFVCVCFLMSGCGEDNSKKSNNSETVMEELSEENKSVVITDEETSEIAESQTRKETVSEVSKDKGETTSEKDNKEDNNGVSEIIKKTNTTGLSNKKIGWYFMKKKDHTTPGSPSEIKDIEKYDAYYVGDTSEKVIYLTFDEGYENGYSSKILDVLDEYNVKAAFFVTKSYIKENQELVKRMISEGHIVGNHSVKHLSSPDLSDKELENELIETANYFKEVTGEDMPKFFRPPMGEFSERTLSVTKNLGYKSIFWSFAYKDWETDNQPGKEAAYKNIMDNYHNGEIALLHAVSKSNTEALGDVITDLREKGYRFAGLDEL